VAHEAVFRRWGKLREWIAAEREFLAWKSGLEVAQRVWRATPDQSKGEALLMGLALAQAQSWIPKRSEDIPAADRQFIKLSYRASQQRKLRIQLLVLGVAIGEAFAIFVGLFAWANQSYLIDQFNWYTTSRPYIVQQVRPYVLSAEAEQALKPLASFRECAKDCPEMIVIPAGSFTMGSPATEKDRYTTEDPQHKVTIARAFAVSKFDVTFEDWDTCVSVRGCRHVVDSGFGRGTRPVINVSWDDAHEYVAWLSLATGQPYRLLTEAEWEYAARAGTTAAYFWGDEIGKGNANCAGCGSQWDNLRTAPVGSFKPNAFGLYDMAGNVWQWVEDCYHDSYDGAPVDGSAWAIGDCSRRVLRGGSWNSGPHFLRSANRAWLTPGNRVNNVGFRLGRTLTP
jgi:formylglycine-generating enzyme required for sulfatase activity